MDTFDSVIEKKLLQNLNDLLFSIDWILLSYKFIRNRFQKNFEMQFSKLIGCDLRRSRQQGFLLKGVYISYIDTTVRPLAANSKKKQITNSKLLRGIT